ncbi:Ribonuclease E inhibitor RraA/Dimethylmenaquinone methyltransferase [Ceraceosorus bombacis]|uniref:Ribonuclease E inhibitor RraA/Dimethylmenaquinone methyltransferase n=1 Tax=Ceraceosorus bombacis TaxID=401625 RepID=A0A0P1BDK3_9BASI|nr:Ribonuclease E inhibitor RraA/Dimethylmenaquinone methyltransferase [Ceraceosorus bombacis]
MSTRTGIASSIIASLLRFSTCEVSDALIKLKHPTGGLLPGLDMFSPSHLSGETRICGPAFTVQMVEGSDKDAPKPEQHFVDAAERDSVMVISAPSEVRSAVWGGLMTARAQARGVKGIVIDGRCRDLSEHREAGFAVFARGHSTLGQSPFTRPSLLQSPITITDPTLPSTSPFHQLVVHPDDLVLADLDGVVVVPPTLVEQVLELAQKGREVDEKCMKDLKEGKGVKETFAKWRGK